MKIYIGGISDTVKDQDLLDLYSQYGRVEKVDLLKDNNTGQNRGYAFITFADDVKQEDVEAAILGTNNTLLGGMNIAVSLSRSRLDQKRAKQSQGKKFQRNSNRRNFKPRKFNNRSYDNNKNNINNDDEPNYNTTSYPKKGVDYGRVADANRVQTSFLGQEDFALTPRTMTMGPGYNANSNNGNGKTYRRQNGYKKNFKRQNYNK